jgi:glycosyltransferase involved in cell wall biosynthesis
MAPSHLALSQNEEDVVTAKTERIAHPSRVRLLGNGIDVRAFDPALFPPARRAEIRRSLGLGPEHLVVGMVARLVKEKGYLEMFEAAARIAAVEPRARFLFVGPTQPDKADGLGPDAVERAGIAHVAQLLGHRDDVPALTSVMDVFALPSHREGVPRAPMEAAAMGVPSVATDIRGCRQVVVDGVTGRLVPVRSPAALADAILELLRDPAKRQRMGAAAREKSAVDFDERRVFERVLAAYEELAAERLG